MERENIFYIYAYLDPRKLGKYTYKEYSFDYEPFYIGKGQDDRMFSHLKETLENTCNTHKTGKIQHIKEVGLNPIIFKIRDNLKEQESYSLEKKYIKTIGRSDLKKGPLTNQTDGGDGLTNHIFSEEHKKNLSKANSGKKISNETMAKRALNPPKNNKSVIQYNLQLNILNEFCSISEAVRCTKISHRSIAKVCIGKYKTAGGFLWSFENELPILPNKISKKEQKPKKERKHYKVFQYDLNLNKINEFKSPMDAQNKTGIRNVDISRVCLNKQKTAFGFIWKYAYNVKQQEQEKNVLIEKYYLRKGNGHKSIVQFSIDGYFIRKYNSITEASKINTFKKSNISACLTKQSKTSNNFLWFYLSDFKDNQIPINLS